MDYKLIQEVFNKYTSEYNLKEKEFNLKYHHSYAVADLMAELAYRLELSDEEIILAKVIGLLHDIGRFEQFKRYQSFSDTNVDHADVSCHYLFDDYHIIDFGIDENSKEATIIKKAIRNHNKLEIEDGLDEKELLFVKMIRDMDKVDIFKQIAVHYQYTFDADKVTKEVLEDFKNEKVVSRKLVKSKSDDTLIACSFIFDFNFNESFDILVETDNFDLFLSTIEIKENSEKLWRKVREICFDRINRGVGDDYE